MPLCEWEHYLACQMFCYGFYPIWDTSAEPVRESGTQATFIQNCVVSKQSERYCFRIHSLNAGLRLSVQRTESLIQAVWVTNYLCHLLQKIKDKNNSKLTQKWLVLDQIDRLTSQQSVFFTVLCIYCFQNKSVTWFLQCVLNEWWFVLEIVQLYSSNYPWSVFRNDWDDVHFTN